MRGTASLRPRSVVGAGAFGADAVSGETVYVPCTNGLTAVAVRGKSLHLLWRSSGGGEGSPVVAGGKVWEETPTGALFGINASTGAVVQTMNLPAPATHFPWVIAVGRALLCSRWPERYCERTFIAKNNSGPVPGWSTLACYRTR